MKKFHLLLILLALFPFSVWAGDAEEAIENSLTAFKKAGTYEVAFRLGMKMGEKVQLFGTGKIQYSSPTLIRTKFKEQARKIYTTTLYQSPLIYQEKTRGQITVRNLHKLGIELKGYPLPLIESLWLEDRNLVGVLTILPPMMLQILQSYSNLKMGKKEKGVWVMEGTPKPREEQGALRPWDPLGMPCEIYLDQKTQLPMKILWKNIRKGKVKTVFVLEYSNYKMGKKLDQALFKLPSEKMEVYHLPKGWQFRKDNEVKKGKEGKPGKGKEGKPGKGREGKPGEKKSSATSKTGSVWSAKIENLVLSPCPGTAIPFTFPPKLVK